MPMFRCSTCKATMRLRLPTPPEHCPACGHEIRPAVRVADWVKELSGEAVDRSPPPSVRDSVEEHPGSPSNSA
jgi:DNA-directed RNA polymerase subunit RPC12/RpoP